MYLIEPFVLLHSILKLINIFGVFDGMQIDNLVEEVKKTCTKRVMLQLPAGLKTKATEIAAALEKENIQTILALNPCYGACDLADEEAKQLNCELLVHVGHSKFYRNFETAVPVMYFPWFVDVKIADVDFSIIKEERIGLLTTVQHLTILSETKDMLNSQGKTAVIGGQVLGCWFANADKIAENVDAFLYVGSGRFHPLGVRDKKIYAFDLEKMKVEPVDPTTLEKRRYANIYNAKDARTFAILVTTKKGQNELLGKAAAIKAKLKAHDREAFVLVMNEINDSALLGIKADAFVNTACPRIVEDHFSKPIINAEDLDKLFE